LLLLRQSNCNSELLTYCITVFARCQPFNRTADEYCQGRRGVKTRGSALPHAV
jgi:hypothetical protein